MQKKNVAVDVKSLLSSEFLIKMSCVEYPIGNSIMNMPADQANVVYKLHHNKFNRKGPT